MDTSKDAAIEIIDGQLDNFREALFSFSSADVLWLEDVEKFMHAKRFFFREARVSRACGHGPVVSIRRPRSAPKGRDPLSRRGWAWRSKLCEDPAR